MGRDKYILREEEPNVCFCDTKNVTGLEWAIIIQKSKLEWKMQKCSLPGHCEVTVLVRTAQGATGRHEEGG